MPNVSKWYIMEKILEEGVLMDVKSVGIIGAGAWGTALGTSLARGGHNVEIWALEQDVTDSINSVHENKRYLPGYSLSPNLTASCDIKKVALDKDFLGSQLLLKLLMFESYGM